MKLPVTSLRKIILVWVCVTVALCVGFVLYAQTLPRDELVMANTLSFKIVTSLVVVGVPSLFALFVVLFIMVRFFVMLCAKNRATGNCRLIAVNRHKSLCNAILLTFLAFGYDSHLDPSGNTPARQSENVK